MTHARRTLTAGWVVSAVLFAPAPAAADGLPAGQTFTYTGDEQSYVVPVGVTELQVFAVGAKGGSESGGGSGGLGATATADLPVSPGETLYVEVGGNGASSGGFNGGGTTAGGLAGADGGGGASDVRLCSRTGAAACSSGSDTLSSRLLVAGGGGGGGTASNAGGGHGGAGGQGGAAGGFYNSGVGGDVGGGGHPGSPGAGGAGGSGGPAAPACAQGTPGGSGATGGFATGGAGGANGDAGGAGGGGDWAGGGGGAGTCGSGGGGGGGGGNYATTFASNVSFAVNTAAVASEVVITPIAGTPAATTLTAADLSPGGASLQASVDPNGLDTSYRFQYGLTAAYGSETPLEDSGSGSAAAQISAAVTGLAPDTLYHFRVIAFSAAGFVAGADQTFTTQPAPTGTTGAGTAGSPGVPQIELRTRSARVIKKHARVTLECTGPPGGTCRGALMVTVRNRVLAQASYGLQTGHTQVVKLRVTVAGLRLLRNASHHRLRSQLTAGGTSFSIVL